MRRWRSEEEHKEDDGGEVPDEAQRCRDQQDQEGQQQEPSSPPQQQPSQDTSQHQHQQQNQQQHQEGGSARQMPALGELHRLPRAELERLCAKHRISFRGQEDDKLVAMLALRGPFGRAGKMLAVQKVRDWVTSVDDVLREIGVLGLDGPAMMDLLNARFKSMQRHKRRRMDMIAEENEEEGEGTDDDEGVKPLTVRRRLGISAQRSSYPLHFSGGPAGLGASGQQVQHGSMASADGDAGIAEDERLLLTPGHFGKPLSPRHSPPFALKLL